MSIFRVDGTLEPAILGYNVAIQYVVQNQTMAGTQHGTCLSYRDPMSDVIATLNTAMMYTGAFAAKAPRDDLSKRLDAGLEDSINTTVIGHVTGEHNVFHSNYWWFLAAVVVEVVCISTLIPTYWGWWRLGRGFSFSPLEVAQVCGRMM